MRVVKRNHLQAALAILAVELQKISGRNQRPVVPRVGPGILESPDLYHPPGAFTNPTHNADALLRVGGPAMVPNVVQLLLSQHEGHDSSQKRSERYLNPLSGKTVT